MFTTIIATVSAITLLQTINVNDVALEQPAQTRRATVNGNASISADVRYTTLTANDHMMNAKRAMTDGQFDIARREFSSAASIERQEGKLPVAATIGLADALYAQSYNREAAIILEQLANDAALRGDIDTEAVALADAIWLNADAGQKLVAKKLTTRLRSLMKDTPLSSETRKAIHNRLG